MKTTICPNCGVKATREKCWSCGGMMDDFVEAPKKTRITREESRKKKEVKTKPRTRKTKRKQAKKFSFVGRIRVRAGGSKYITIPRNLKPFVVKDETYQVVIKQLKE